MLPQMITVYSQTKQHLIWKLWHTLTYIHRYFISEYFENQCFVQASFSLVKQMHRHLKHGMCIVMKCTSKMEPLTVI